MVDHASKERRRRWNGAEATLAQSVEQLIRNQQVVGSNPTGGSKKPNEFKAFLAHLSSHSAELQLIVRKLSEFVKRPELASFFAMGIQGILAG